MSIFLTRQKIIKDWTDYNGHMNVAYYVLLFDQYGSEVLLTSFQMGEESAKTTKKVLWLWNLILLMIKRLKKMTK